jgi:hypothetical protein
MQYTIIRGMFNQRIKCTREKVLNLFIFPQTKQTFLSYYFLVNADASAIFAVLHTRVDTKVAFLLSRNTK